MKIQTRRNPRAARRILVIGEVFVAFPVRVVRASAKTNRR
jgi:hypothetical protein